MKESWETLFTDREIEEIEVHMPTMALLCKLMNESFALRVQDLKDGHRMADEIRERVHGALETKKMGMH